MNRKKAEKALYTYLMRIEKAQKIGFLANRLILLVSSICSLFTMLLNLNIKKKTIFWILYSSHFILFVWKKIIKCTVEIVDVNKRRKKLKQLHEFLNIFMRNSYAYTNAILCKLIVNFNKIQSLFLVNINDLSLVKQKKNREEKKTI